MHISNRLQLLRCRWAGLQLALLVFVSPGFGFQSEDLVRQARSDLFADRYDRAIERYRKALAQEPSGEAWYGLTRALLKAHRSKEAYTAADEGLQKSPQTPGAQTAAGLAFFRKGDIPQAENYFRAALKLDGGYPGALIGLAAIHASVSNAKTARELQLKAYATTPEDPVLMMAHANSLKGEEHIAALEQALAAIDPVSDEARGLRAHIASDRALGGRKVRRLMSAYEPSRIKMVYIRTERGRLRGYGIRAQFNQHHTVTLMLDTGASGISLTPKTADKAGLELLANESGRTRGIGDKNPQDTLQYLASEMRIGNVTFADQPVSAFRTAKDSDIDGLIGADVFLKFIVHIDFPELQIALEPYPAPPGEDLQDAGPLPEGFSKVVRSGTHLLIATSVNGSAAKRFLIDSGGASNLIDTESARDYTGVHQDELTMVRGVQGKVDRVSRADRISLVFGGFRQENTDLLAISLEKPSDSMGMAVTGILGIPVLSQLKLSIDYRAGAVRFERPR